MRANLFPHILRSDQCLRWHEAVKGGKPQAHLPGNRLCHSSETGLRCVSGYSVFLVRHPLPILPFENASEYAALRFTVAQFGVSGLEPGKLERKNGIDQFLRFFQIVAYPVTVHDSPLTVQSSKFKVQSSRFKVQGSGSGSRFKVQGSGFRVQGSGFRVQGSGFRVQGSGFRVQGSGFRILLFNFEL